MLMIHFLGDFQQVGDSRLSHCSVPQLTLVHFGLCWYFLGLFYFGFWGLTLSASLFSPSSGGSKKGPSSRFSALLLI